MHENRETSGTSRSNPDRDRSEKAVGRTAGRHVSEGSDRAVVPVNLSNKEGHPSAEMGEGRARAKENIDPSNTNPTQSGNDCPVDGAVCVKQQRKGSRNGSQLCSTM